MHVVGFFGDLWVFKLVVSPRLVSITLGSGAQANRPVGAVPGQGRLACLILFCMLVHLELEPLSVEFLKFRTFELAKRGQSDNL